jgi:hypothetical protein
MYFLYYSKKLWQKVFLVAEIAAVEKRKGGPGGGERLAGPAEKMTGGS